MILIFVLSSIMKKKSLKSKNGNVLMWMLQKLTVLYCHHVTLCVYGKFGKHSL